MRDASQEALAFASGKTKEDLDSDRMLYHAIKDCITIVGEASYKVSRDFQDAHPDIPWHSLIRFRHELVHDCSQIDSDVMWDTVVKSFPGLIQQIEAVIQHEES
jgi:uncharacterized protein with HEPN domain